MSLLSDTSHMNRTFYILLFLASCVFGIAFYQTLCADELDDILGPETAVVPSDAEEDADAPWTPPAPYVLPPALDELQLRKLDAAISALDIPPSLAASLRYALTASPVRGEILTSTGLVILTPPVLADPLASLESWLRIARAANITELPAFASGSPAWVRWRQLSSNPLTTEADWIGFYRALAS
ncbi:hypothetical protein OpiT1DRAFT_03962 [Opitutaceae bacterium TAV1]|nr:hypothetical protein OpiT1DRAFT_03962 [Opitutaceae bacterium TAV1]